MTSGCVVGPVTVDFRIQQVFPSELLGSQSTATHLESTTQVSWHLLSVPFFVFLSTKSVNILCWRPAIFARYRQRKQTNMQTDKQSEQANRQTNLQQQYIGCCNVHVYGIHRWLKNGKGNPYSITERRVPQLIQLLCSQPAGDVSHKPGGRLKGLRTVNRGTVNRWTVNSVDT